MGALTYAGTKFRRGLILNAKMGNTSIPISLDEDGKRSRALRKI